VDGSAELPVARLSVQLQSTDGRVDLRIPSSRLQVFDRDENGVFNSGDALRVVEEDNLRPDEVDSSHFVRVLLDDVPLNMFQGLLHAPNDG
jgi:hypothetical protein